MSNENLSNDVMTSFLDEAGQYIATLNDNLLVAENGECTREMIDEMFRAAHSMKGNAGFLNLTDIMEVTHNMETVLDKVRKDKLSFSTDVVDALFSAFDVVSSLLAGLVNNAPEEIDIAPSIKILKSVIQETESESDEDPEELFGPLPSFIKNELTIDDLLEGMVAINNGMGIYVMRFTMQDILDSESDPISIYHALESSLKIQTVLPIIEKMVDQDEGILNYQYDVALLCFCKESIRSVLMDVISVPFHFWTIEKRNTLGEPKMVNNNLFETDLGERCSTLSMKPDMEKHKKTWFSETNEELDQLDSAIMLFEESENKSENVNELFRLIHRLKSSSAAMGFNEMARVAHNCESFLSYFRDTKSIPNDDDIKILFQSKDFLNECIVRIKEGVGEAPESMEIDKLLSQFFAQKGLDKSEKNNKKQIVYTESEQEILKDIDGLKQPVWKMVVTLKDDTLFKDLRYSMIIRSLDDVVNIFHSEPDIALLEDGLDSPPPLQILFTTDYDDSHIRSIVSFDMVKSVLLTPVSIGGNETNKNNSKTNDTILTKKENVVTQTKSTQRAVFAGSDTVRVDTARLDTMMNVAGELVITKARVFRLSEIILRSTRQFNTREVETLLSNLNRAVSENDLHGISQSYISKEKVKKLGEMLHTIIHIQETSNELREAVTELHRHTNSVQNGVMQIRMVPVGPLFQRFHRLIRDLCKERGKSARLVTVGEGTELDKKLIDELTDPLTHLIRNSVDHGLETEKDRAESGKSEQGTVTLEAFHEGGQICIRINDDGKGLDIEKIKNKAIGNGIITKEGFEKLTEDEIFKLIFQPGFSTAKKVTNISGRGVGMDIVKNKINELKGKIEIKSERGKGSSFTLRLPLTLAMIDSLLVNIGRGRYAFPLEGVREIVDIPVDEIRSVEGKGKMISLRNEAIALIDLSTVIDVDPLASNSQMVRAVITKNAGDKLSIAVDSIIGNEEIVVKSLPEEFEKVHGISGSTVLGDGGIALILDINTITDMSNREKSENVKSLQEEEMLCLR